MDEFDIDLATAFGPIGLVVMKVLQLHLEAMERQQQYHLAVLDRVIEVERARRGPGGDDVFRHDGAGPGLGGGTAGRSQAAGSTAGQNADLAPSPMVPPSS